MKVVSTEAILFELELMVSQAEHVMKMAALGTDSYMVTVAERNYVRAKNTFDFIKSLEFDHTELTPILSREAV